MIEVAKVFCTSAHRVKLFTGLIAYRQKLAALGMKGWQWLDGSFCEDVESNRGKSPSDIDIVTLLIRPASALAPTAFSALVSSNVHLFDRTQVKAQYYCDPFFVDVGLPTFQTMGQLTYYFGLFTHQRVSYLWKGILQVPLIGDDSDAETYINSLTFNP
jgi:hypothetical protein